MITREYETEAGWLEARRKLITASDASVVLGKNKWKSPFALWAEKSKGVNTVTVNDAMRWGLALEPAIADAFDTWAVENLDHYTILEALGQHTLCIHEDLPWMGATLDRVVMDGVSPIGVLEIKTSNARRTKEWDEGVPIDYQIQVQHQLAVTGLPYGWVAVLIGGSDFRVFDCPRNDRFIAKMIEAETAFWKMVQDEAPPETDGSDSTASAIKALYPDGNDMGIELSADDWADKLDALEACKQIIKDNSETIKEIENELKAVIGEASYADIGPHRYTYKQQTRKAHMVQESSFRVLRKTTRKEID